ncbi:MAG: 50S ribosomal protein L29 [Candidatus Uhrbacteria bacterium GW2011_GWE2_46_68]|uniref:Large ribosomal subunit protein uL29 n=2 Tax=Candidatus Uhriibacteriota TaxID=1752732 RepID=A0A0G1Q828_9BACT|nr:MAG: 50S ribosomal protein L29 [Candidatus Uhrbacteria bacterium GW2011_GWF2_46_218]KKU41191.1 MAG: 50S ribosomal protein L29 [Candidatus Uhrbacteria bacterium GW2011_GWE2_46_68]
MQTMDVVQLQKEIQDRQAQKMDFRFQISSHQLSRVRQVRKVRKEIAQLKTLLRQKTLEK